MKGPTNKLVRIDGIILAIANRASARGEPVLLKTRMPKAIPAAEFPIADINVPTVKIVKFLVQSFIVYLIFTSDIIALSNQYKKQPKSGCFYFNYPRVLIAAISSVSEVKSFIFKSGSIPNSIDW